MKTKTIFKTLALAMMMPAMMLNTACSSDDDSIINNENINKQNTAKKGYALPVTVNVTRQGDAATRASFDGSKLNFSAGDKLFVNGRDNDGAGKFAGELTWQSGGTFSGTIYTENPYSGTADKLFSAAPSIYATLLPYGYESTGFLYVLDNNTTDIIYDDVPTVHETYAFVASETAKATGVEQLSWERANAYNSGFALAPLCAVLNFTISGLAAGTQNVTLRMNKDKDYLVTGSVTPNALGVATFAVGVKGGSTIRNTENNLTVGSSNFNLPSSTTFAAGKIYNIARSALITSPAVGQVIGDNGKNYANAAAAEADGATAVAMIAYVGKDAETSPSNTAFKNGLALALEDVSGTKAWCSQTSFTCLGTQYDNSTKFNVNDLAGIDNTDALVNHTGHTHAAASAARGYNSGTHPAGTSAWFLPSAGQWDKMATAAGSYANLKANAGLQELASYWSSTEYDASRAWFFDYSVVDWLIDNKDNEYLVRACLAF